MCRSVSVASYSLTSKSDDTWVSGCKTSGCHLLANACGVQSLAGSRQMGFSMDNGIRFPVSFFIILYFQEIVKKKTCFSVPIVIKYRENAKRKDIFA